MKLIYSERLDNCYHLRVQIDGSQYYQSVHMKFDGELIMGSTYKEAAKEMIRRERLRIITEYERKM